MRRREMAMLGLAGVLLLGPAGCGEAPPIDPLPMTRLTTDRTYLRDGYGRYLFFHGVNLSGSTKVPARIDDDGVASYVGKPFPLEQADAEFAKLRALGFNAVRLLLMWEGIAPVERGVYDQAYLDYLRQIVASARQHGIWVLLDMHQDMFSRHLRVEYNRHPAQGEPGSLEHTLLSLVPDAASGEYDDVVQGDGAPRWAVAACLQEKKLDSPHWGTPRILSGLDLEQVGSLWALVQDLLGLEDGGEVPAWVGDFILGLPGPFPVDETTDLLPFTTWFLAYVLSLDLARCYGCLLAGDELFPELRVEGETVEDYLQGGYAEAWAQVAERVGGQVNVIGYDLMNEPGANFLTLTAAAALIRTGAHEGARDALTGLLGEADGQRAYDALLALKILPPDTEPETLQRWGLAEIDPMAVFGLNVDFNEHHMRPFIERVGAGIVERDPQAIIWIESALSADTYLSDEPGGGILGQWGDPMTHPEGLEQVVYAPHWYPDIYPMPGFNSPPRAFTAEEVRHRDYDDDLRQHMAQAAYSLGNIPVVYGEFGTYFNYNGIAQARRQNYIVSAHILDNYYESFERLFTSNFLWCYSPENDFELGDLWNHEDFSIIDPRGAPRGAQAWRRPYAAALAGKPIATHYYSPLHYFDPDKGQVNPVGEFEVVYAAKETGAPSEIVIPEGVYPDGFYVWVSDGICHYDPQRHVLYHKPARDEPGVEHRVRLLPPLAGNENRGWQYFFDGDRVIAR